MISKYVICWGLQNQQTNKQTLIIHDNCQFFFLCLLLQKFVSRCDKTQVLLTNLLDITWYDKQNLFDVIMLNVMLCSLIYINCACFNWSINNYGSCFDCIIDCKLAFCQEPKSLYRITNCKWSLSKQII